MPGGGGQLGRGERERRGQGVGVEGTSLAERVDPDRQSGGPALQHAPGGRLGVEKHRRAHRADSCALGLQLLFGAGVHGEVEADPEQLLLAPGQAGGEVAGVLGGDLDLGIAQASLGRVRSAPRFEAGQLAAQAFGGDVGGDGLDVDGDVEAAGVGGERLEPTARHLSRVARDGEAGAPTVSDPQRPRPDLEGVGAERRGGPSRWAGEASEQAGHRESPFWRARVMGSSVP